MRSLIMMSILAAAITFSTSAFAKENTMVELQTSMGNIVIELFEAEAPLTTANFKEYVKDGFYDGTIFHRVIENFMIQGGGLTEDMAEKETRAPIRNEADNGLKNDKYTVAMARTNDPHSASSQFFINAKNNDFLNFTAPSGSGWGYAVFGRVVEGAEVVDAIRKVGTASFGFHNDVPEESVVIKKAVLKKSTAKKADAKKADGKK